MTKAALLRIIVANESGARRFIWACCELLGEGFHPDTEGAQYITHPAGRPTFKKADAKLFDLKMAKAFGYLGHEVYALSNQYLRQIRQAGRTPQ